MSNKGNKGNIWVKVNLGSEVHKRLKVKAAQLGVTMQGLMVEFIWHGLDGENCFVCPDCGKKHNHCIHCRGENGGPKKNAGSSVPREEPAKRVEVTLANPQVSAYTR